MGMPTSAVSQTEIFSRSLSGLFENRASLAACLLGNRQSFDQRRELD
jgi:hypothetical protein